MRVGCARDRLYDRCVVSANRGRRHDLPESLPRALRRLRPSIDLRARVRDRGQPYAGDGVYCGCWLEGGREAFGNILAAIRHFVAENRILLVRFRNITSPLPVFTETFLDDGYMDMYAVMRAFVEAGYSNTMILDHTPRFVEGYEAAGTGYAIGYMRSCCPNTRWSGRRRS